MCCFPPSPKHPRFVSFRSFRSQGFRPSVVSDTYLSEVKSAEEIHLLAAWHLNGFKHQAMGEVTQESTLAD